MANTEEKSVTYLQITKDGIWDNNVVLSQMLALCPLLAVTSTATNGLGMGLATTFVLIISNLVIALFRDIITSEVRIPIFVLIIAGVVTIVDMTMNAWMHDLYKVLGLFIPLIVTNCAILGRAESFASKNNIKLSVYDGLMMGVGFLLVLVILGGFREILGSGTLFSNASLLLGESFAFLETTLIPEYRGFLIMIMPPGGFLALGFILAAKRRFDKVVENKKILSEKQFAENITAIKT